jgi:hypothetical protein
MGKSQNAQRKTRRSNFNVRDAPPLCSPSTGSTLVFHKSDPCSRFLVHSCIDVHVRSLLIYDTNMRTLDEVLYGRFDDLIFGFSIETLLQTVFDVRSVVSLHRGKVEESILQRVRSGLHLCTLVLTGR